MTALNALTAPRNAPTQKGGLDPARFPKVGPDRFFVVKHRAHRTQPIVIELRESLTAGRTVVGMSVVLGFDYTHADPDTIYEVAATLEARVGKVDEVVGLYAQP